MLEDVQFRELGEMVKVEKVKVVACDGKGRQKINSCILDNLCIFVVLCFATLNYISHQRLHSQNVDLFWQYLSISYH